VFLIIAMYAYASRVACMSEDVMHNKPTLTALTFKNIRGIKSHWCVTVTTKTMELVIDLIEITNHWWDQVLRHRQKLMELVSWVLLKSVVIAVSSDTTPSDFSLDLVIFRLT